MRNFIFAIILSITFGEIAAQAENYVQSDTVWCIQVLSTRNPHLLRPEMLSAFDDPAMVEHCDGWYRIVFVYAKLEDAQIHLQSWQRQHKKAFITTRSRSQEKKMYPLYTYD
jgi:hypothetical protein